MLLMFQIYSSRELEETLNKIREILSDDKHDWDQRTNAVNFLSDFNCGVNVFHITQMTGYFKKMFLVITFLKIKATLILDSKTFSFHVSNHFWIRFCKDFKRLKCIFLTSKWKLFQKLSCMVFVVVFFFLHILHVNC